MKAFYARAILSSDFSTALSDRAVLVEGDKIKGVVKKENAKEYTNELYDLGNSLMIPGFANTHSHVAMSVLRGIRDGARLREWLNKVWEIEARLRQEVLFYANIVGLYEMVSSGVTAVLDFYDVWPFVEALSVTGMPVRAFAGLAFMDKVEYMKEESWRRVKLIKDYEKKLSESGVGLFLSPHSLYSNTLDMLMELGRIDYGMFQMHFLETEDEEAEIIKNLGMGPVDALRLSGLMDKQRLILAHAVYAGRYINDIKRENVFVSSCPISNARLYSGIAPVSEMALNGVNVSVGTDGAGSSDTLDMLDQIRALIYLNRGFAKRLRLDASEALFMASRNGYRALNLNGGEIKEGALADFFTVDLDLAMPYLELPGLVYQANRFLVKDVVVGGRFIKMDHKISFVDQFIKSKERLMDFMGGIA